MIPTVEDILRDIAAGKISHAQAMAWMEEHFKMAMEQETPAGFTLGPNHDDKWRCTHCGAPAEDQEK